MDRIKNLSKKDDIYGNFAKTFRKAQLIIGKIDSMVLFFELSTK